MGIDRDISSVLATIRHSPDVVSQLYDEWGEEGPPLHFIEKRLPIECRPWVHGDHEILQRYCCTTPPATDSEELGGLLQRIAENTLEGEKRWIDSRLAVNQEPEEYWEELWWDKASFNPERHKPKTLPIQALKLPVYGHSIVYGSEKTGKTTFVAGLAVEAAMNNIRTVYIMNEDPPGVLGRLEAAANYRGTSLDKLTIAIPPERIILTDHSALNSALRRLMLASNELWGNWRISPQLVIIDTLAKSIGEVDETHQMGLYTQSVRRIIELFDCHVLTIHHTIKSDATTIRGGGQLACDADILYNVRLNTRTGTSRIECIDVRTGAKPEPVHFKSIGSAFDAEIPITVPAGSVPVNAPPEDEGDKPLGKHAEQVLKILADAGGYIKKESLSTAWTESGSRRQGRYDGIKELLDIGLVLQEGDGLALVR